MKLNILVSLFLLSIAQATLCEKQVVAHAITQDEQHVVIVNNLLNDLKLITRNSDSFDSMEDSNYLFNKYGTSSEFRFLCAFFDVMHKECHGKIVVSENHAGFNEALHTLKDVLVNHTSNNAVSFIKLYQQARNTYKNYMNCPEFVDLFNVFIKINKFHELKSDQHKTDDNIKRFKRMAMGALAAFAEGAVNTLIE